MNKNLFYSLKCFHGPPDLILLFEFNILARSCVPQGAGLPIARPDLSEQKVNPFTEYANIHSIEKLF